MGWRPELGGGRLRLLKVMTESWNYEVCRPDIGLWLWLWAWSPDGVPVLFHGSDAQQQATPLPWLTHQ